MGSRIAHLTLIRPCADLNRNRTLDFFSEETGKLESDRDYQRTVQDVRAIVLHRSIHYNLPSLPHSGYITRN